MTTPWKTIPTTCRVTCWIGVLVCFSAAALAASTQSVSGALAATPALTRRPTGCVPRQALDSLAGPIACEAIGRIIAPLFALPFECHTQGIGWHDVSRTFVVTCMDEGAGATSGRALSFPCPAEPKRRVARLARSRDPRSG